MKSSPLVNPDHLRQLQAKDAAAIASAVHDYTDALLNAAYGLGFRNTDAEEIVQETYVTFFERVHTFEGRSTVKTYLFGILYYKILEKRRELAKEQATDPIDEVFEKRFGVGGLWRTVPRGPEEEALSKETLAAIQVCVERLAVSHRMAFYLKEVEHQPTEEICNILGVNATHVGVLLFRARNKVRECLEKKWGKQR